MGAERLPGKMMMDLGGKPILAHVIDRLKLCKSLHHIIVATPDKELAQFAYDRGVWGYPDAGDPNNVLLRYIKAAGWAGSQIVVRITGDCPLIDPYLVDRMVEEYVNRRVDLVSNVFRRSFPKGMDVEVLHINTLKRIYHLTDNPVYREHVTLFCYEKPALFEIFNVSDRGRDHSYINLSIDTKKDLDKVYKLIQVLKCDAGIDDIVREYEKMEVFG